MEKLIEILHSENYSCVIENSDGIHKFSRRGVADLYDLLKNKPNFLQNSRIADKIVGKGAATLMILGKVQEVYADIISVPALNFLKNAEIKINFGITVPFIQNRAKNDYCPLEKICYNLATVEEIFPKLEEFVIKMMQKSENKC